MRARDQGPQKRRQKTSAISTWQAPAAPPPAQAWPPQIPAPPVEQQEAAIARELARVGLI